MMSSDKPTDEGGNTTCMCGFKPSLSSFTLSVESSMELKATCVLLLLILCVTIFTSTADGIPRCCVTVSKKIRRSDLQKVSKYDLQKKNGRCDIDAVILYIKQKKICADPKILGRLKKIKKKNNPKKA
ncbi:C-C motif chemokine 27a [Misgurnus anguillicaudatus]|uniref:C-C motif chemokine 27a n=1 Tax=Misgurnus anguillicaudatus TaxID=75329 RepID=UPI003CCF5C46